jgi:SNF2 family DNA or RNA helicase
MGLGKTIQTISLLAYLAVYKGIWGPHLIIAPTSCIVNWEVEFKKFCPGFKVLTYFGSSKNRKLLRQGWSKLNSFHICITSYQLVVQDANAFRRKKWYYLILDEAHSIKNFKSKRWQTLMNFDSIRRLLLTGTPLQNNLMELWSLMHFLMPHVFNSRKEFAYWFSNPLESALDGVKAVNNDIVGKLHSIIRPFILRRLKCDVAQQLPKKYEHTLYCKLTKRQKLLYEEFLSAASNKPKSDKSYLAMMNLLMQLRKVCDHPDLIEPRMIATPFNFESIKYLTSSKFSNLLRPRNQSTCIFFWDDFQYSLQDTNSKTNSAIDGKYFNKQIQNWEFIMTQKQLKRKAIAFNDSSHLRASFLRLYSLRNSFISAVDNVRSSILLLDKSSFSNYIPSIFVKRDISWLIENLLVAFPAVISAGP